MVSMDGWEWGWGASSAFLRISYLCTNQGCGTDKNDQKQSKVILQVPHYWL